MALIALRIPIAYAMIIVGGVGMMTLSGPAIVLAQLKNLAYSQFSIYDLSVLPMFVLMGNLASRAGLSRDLFRAANAWLGWMRGGVAMSAIAACAGFGAVCGSSLATASTMGQVALPELRRYRYSPELATGTLAAGGMLGILIPPSVVLIVYAIVVEASIVTHVHRRVHSRADRGPVLPGHDRDLRAREARSRDRRETGSRARSSWRRRSAWCRWSSSSGS